MTYIWKALKWAYGDSFRYIGFLVTVAVVAGLAEIFLSYPLQFIFSAIALVTVYAIFTFFVEL